MVRLAVLVAGFVSGCVLFARPRRLPSATRRDAPRVSVVIPARDEAHALPALLDALAAQDPTATEVVVVDDDSNDATAAVAAGRGARVIASERLPDGWTGKTWACWQGAAHATGDLLVFLDADTRPSAVLLSRLVAVHARDGGLVSVQPYHRMEKTYERASAIPNVVAFMGTGAASLRRGARITGAFGPCLVCSRVDYLATGGHEAVRDAVVEDVALARLFAANELPVHAYAGGDAISFRMYPLGVRQLVEGWTKNLATGARGTPPLRTLGVVLWITAMLTAVIALVTAPGVVAVAWYVAFACQLWLMLRPLGNFGATALLYPVEVIVFVALFVRSLVATATGRVRWKGRSVAVRGARS
jgi:4,4'-diaponeurosporenoate glycosyltransferase